MDTDVCNGADVCYRYSKYNSLSCVTIDIYFSKVASAYFVIMFHGYCLKS